MGLTRRQGRPVSSSQAKKGHKGKSKGSTGGQHHHLARGRKGNQAPPPAKKNPKLGSIAKDVYEYGSGGGGGRRRGIGGDEEQEDLADRYDYKAGDHDDEEIDDDMAFDEEDEARYGDIMRQIEQNDRRRKRSREEEEEEEKDDEGDGDEELGEGEMLLSDHLLGGRGGAEEDEKQKGGTASKQKKGKEKEERREAVLPKSSLLIADQEEEEEEEEEEDDGEEEEEEEDGEGVDQEKEEEDDDEEEGDHEGLMEMIQQLAAANSKSSANGENDDRASSMHLQSIPDSSYRTRPAAGLTMEAMLGALENTRGYAAIRKRLGALVKDGKTAIEAPAPATVQARAERQVVYKEKKKIIGEYLPLIASARQADSLNFSYEVPLRQSKAALVGKFEPQTEMEKAVHGLLVHAKADKETAVEEAEDDDLGARGFTAEQVKIRRAELAKMRALLFYEQQKRHKANKIKSKAYHRIRKRQRLRQEDASREALRAVDPEAARDLDEKDALARAQERMSLRHKNTSKWAKHVMRQGTGHTQVETRKAVAEQLQLGEELRKKAGGKGSSDEEEEDDDEDVSDMDEEQRNALIRQRAAGKVKTLLGEVVDDGQEATAANKGGLMGMKFMTRAVERQRARAQEEVEAVLRELENEEGDGDSSSDEEHDEGKKREAKLNNKSPDTRAAEEDDDEEGQGGEAEGAKLMHQLLEGSLQTAGTRWGGQGGRKMRVSGPITVKISTAAVDEKVEEGQKEEEEEEMVAMQEEHEGVDEQQQVSRTDRGPSSFVMETRQTRSSVITTASSLVAGGGGGRLQQQSHIQEEEDEEEEERDADGMLINPWMTSTTSTASEIRRRQKTKGRAASSQVLDIQRAVEVVTGTSASSSTNKKQEKKGGKGSRGAAAGGEIEDCEEREEEEQEEDEEANTGLVIRGKQQEELVRRAFASVDTEDDFLKDKDEAIKEEEAEREKQLQQQQGKKGGNGPRKGAASMVAGWGSWAGMGATEPAGPSPFPSSSKKGGSGARFSKGGAPAAVASSSNHTSTKGGGGGAATSTHIDKGLQEPRLDRSLPTVVINERRMKKAAKLKVAQVPYPFTSRAQYEASLRRPVGKEWNTMTSVREQTRPAVKVRPGTVVQPIKLRKTHKAVFPTSS